MRKGYTKEEKCEEGKRRRPHSSRNNKKGVPAVVCNGMEAASVMQGGAGESGEGKKKKKKKDKELYC